MYFNLKQLYILDKDNNTLLNNSEYQIIIQDSMIEVNRKGDNRTDDNEWYAIENFELYLKPDKKIKEES